MNKIAIKLPLIILAALFFFVLNASTVKADTENGITVTAPSSFDQNTDTTINLSSTLPNIAEIELFVSKSSEITNHVYGDYSSTSTICSAITNAGDTNNCALCHPTTSHCNSGQCTPVSINLSEIGQHRIVAVALNTKGMTLGCSTSSVLGINNGNIITVNAAANPATPASPPLINSISTGAAVNTLDDLFNRIINNIFPVIIAIGAFFAIVAGGFYYISSEGDSSKAEIGKKAVIYAIIGLVLAILSYAIITAIINTYFK